MTDATDINSTLQNIARQIGAWANTLTNGLPVPTSATSPLSTPIQLSTTATTLIGTSSIRHGIMFHNPGTTIAYIFPSITSAAPTTSSLAGSFVIYPGSTLELPPMAYPNVNCAWSGFVATGSSQPFTVVEFF